MSKEKQIEEMTEYLCNIECKGMKCNTCDHYGCEYRMLAEALYNAGYCKIPDNIGDFSDGYHTFNELYHHRAVLFSVICNMFPEKAWKSKLHDSGDMYDGMFIVGIETEQGQATYHYDIEPYWDTFKVKELEKAPKYDGHTPSDAIARIGGIGHRKQSEWISVEERLPELYTYVITYDTVSGDVQIDSVLSNGEFVIGYNVTHWMPLPEAPKGGEE